MALEGSLLDFGLADILQLIYFQKKTGVLSLNSRLDRVQIIFSEGNIIAVESRKRLEDSRLGRILLKKGLLKEEDLRAALEEHKKTGAKMGDILVSRGLIGKEDLTETLLSQVTETVVQLFSWKEGTYEFQVQPVSADRDVLIALDTQHLLMEGLRIVDEWALVEGKIALDMVFRQTGGPETALTEDEETLLKFIDGDNDVSIIIDLSGISDFEASKTLLSLMEKGLIELVEVSPVVKESVIAPPVSREKPFATFLPVVILVGAFVVSLGMSALKRDGSSITIGSLAAGDLLKRLQTVRDIETLRFRAEEYKYLHGSYPPDLGPLGSAKDAWERAYLYKAENDNLTIVSAGPDGIMGSEDDIH
ncbi:MAG TPA: DUF4388 domain-containing protein [Thermodesulfovibrionales bacterium]|jgi:hypothetical protein|nr:DUF4388 domain-containing protein [Thermodesulfovibrionales bacterium]